MLIVTRIKYKKREQFTSLTFSRYLQTPNALKRVKAHAIRREHLYFTLVHSRNFADLREQESKRTLHNMSVMLYAMLPYAIWFQVLHLFYSLFQGLRIHPSVPDINFMI